VEATPRGDLALQSPLETRIGKLKPGFRKAPTRNQNRTLMMAITLTIPDDVIQPVGFYMLTVTISNGLDEKLSSAAKTQGKTVDQILNALITEYLEDLEDVRLAEAALRRVENGESQLVDWQDAKKHLHDMEH
jgi:predicted DNA-binding protein